MSSSNWYFFYQVKGGSDPWHLNFAEQRQKITEDVKPAFTTVLDLTSIPDDHDWTKVKYRGPLYFDFDADGDLPLVCEQFKSFLGKIAMDLDFDLTQALLFASGSKGFHIEIPQECFIPKITPGGTVWLASVYEKVAQSLVVDTLDFSVYSGKRGRMWRTTNVKRENGCYKVPLTIDEALEITPESYLELIKGPRPAPALTPPFCNTKFAVLYDQCREKVMSHMRGKKKRSEKANALLDPWRKANKTPPSIEKMMAGEGLAPGAAFNKIAMQLGIFATSVGMPLAEYLAKCEGLCDKHVSDGTRYNTPAKRKAELARLYEYMGGTELYDFDPAPIVALLTPGTAAPDLGVMATEDNNDRQDQPADEGDVNDGDVPSAGPILPTVDEHRGVRKGFFMNADGMWRRTGDNVDSICRATLRAVESFYDVEKGDFKGYEFDIVVKGRKTTRAMLSAEAFTSSASLRKFFVSHQLSYQGTDPDATALLDVMAEKAGRGGKVYTYPREGFMVMNHPEKNQPEPVKVFLTQDSYLSSLQPDDPDYFMLRYRPGAVTSSYNIDVHKAPELDESMIPALHDLFTFSVEHVVADLLGWFVACHYRSAYLYLFNQFPLLQIYGEAGSGKTQSVLLMAHLHWYMPERISVKSAMSCTPFAMDAHASSSTSAPFILDEYKPRELRMQKGKYEKLKDVLKATYVGSDIGERGTINRGAENHLAIVKSKATAPICFMGEAIEMETAIIERCVTVNLGKGFHNAQRTAAFSRLQENPVVLSSLGRAVIEMGFGIDFTSMRDEVNEIQAEIEAEMPDFDDDTRRRAAPRLIFNRALITHALRTLQRVLQRAYGDEFDERVEALLSTKIGESQGEEAQVVQVHGISEISKVVSRIALLSRAVDAPFEMKYSKDYLVGDGWVEMKVERAYDNYRRYCASINDTPLFDNLDSFMHALNSYSPCIDRVCASSELREDESSEHVIRLDVRKLKREGVQTFRS